MSLARAVQLQCGVPAAPATRGFSHPVPPALTFLLGHWWGRTGGKEQIFNLSFCPRTVKIAPCSATSSFLTGEGLCFNFYRQTFNCCTFFTTISFICPHNCLQQFKMSKFGAGVRSVNTKPKACPKEIAVKKTKQEKKKKKMESPDAVSHAVYLKRGKILYL